jgi:hypothetical protein
MQQLSHASSNADKMALEPSIHDNKKIAGVL